MGKTQLQTGIKMNTAKLFKEEVSNPAIWNTIIRDLGLPEDTDEISIKAVTYDSDSKRQKSKKMNREG